MTQGNFEPKDPSCIGRDGTPKAPEHHKVALMAQARGANNTRMQKQNPNMTAGIQTELAKEARKYKNAKEFVQANLNLDNGLEGLSGTKVGYKGSSPMKTPGEARQKTRNIASMEAELIAKDREIFEKNKGLSISELQKKTIDLKDFADRRETSYPRAIKVIEELIRQKQHLLNTYNQQYETAEEYADSQINAYHQSQSKEPITKFKQKGDKGYKKAHYSQASEGIYFSPNKELVRNKYGKGGGLLIAVHIDMKNPLDLGHYDAMYFDGRKVLYGELVVENFKREMGGEKPLPEPDIILTGISQKAKKWLIEHGYDSVQGMEGEMWSAPEYVVLSASQIKTREQLIEEFNRARG